MRSRIIYRIAIGALFFILGLCFASWASRIPTIRQKLNISDSNLGLILFALPAGSFCSLPVSGWLINKLSSRIIAFSALFLYGLVLLALGFAQSPFQLVVCLFFYGWLGNTANISINTQALGVQEMYGKGIMASFHGLWSLAGFTGAAVGTYMIARGISPAYHFLGISLLTLCGLALSFSFAIKRDVNNKESTSFFTRPEGSLISLGAIAFCSLICEGAMFDWSGIYFQKIVKADKGMIGAGYSAFMCTMAAGRFMADWFSNRFGVRFTLQGSGLLICMGLLLVVLFPYVATAITGFLLVGFGVCSVVPLVYSLAGKSEKLSAGAALATVSTIGFLGFLLGPPVIGLIAGAFNLRISFLLIALMGLCVTLVTTKVLPAKS